MRGDGRPLRHLVVDDDDVDTLVITEVITDSASPVTIDSVADGQQALDYLRNDTGYRDALRPDLVLLDLNMPRMDGRQTLTEIKTDG